jgi:RNA polymerase sigma-70 factor (ECF subfamily)
VTEDLSLVVLRPRTSQPIDLVHASAIDLSTLVATHSSLLYRVAHSILRNAAEAEDVVQDTFLRVIEHQHKLAAVRELRPWLVRIAWNLALDRRRRIRPDQMDGLFAQGLIANDQPADQAFDEARRLRRVLQQMDALPKKEREVLLLSAIDELNTAEIASIVGRTESAVRALLFRARTHLRKRLEKGVNA